MKENPYYRAVYRRPNPIKEHLFEAFFYIMSYPRLLIEVFIRKNFGRRYFSFAAVVLMLIHLGFLPFAVKSFFYMFIKFDTGEFLKDHAGWYIFLIVVFIFAARRNEEIKDGPPFYSFEKFSLSSGEIRPFFYNFKLFGRKFSVKEVEIYIEPMFPFLIGLAFLLFGQIMIGFTLVLCSIAYSLSYVAAYHNGEDFVMDKIDEIITNQFLFDSFVTGAQPKDTNGFKFYGRRPGDEETRRKVYDAIINDKPVFEAS
jgi:hypothetical protein